MEGGAEPNPLVLYEPQLKQARAALESADTAIRKAELDLQRTVITAPFNCRVRSEELELGQFVRSGVAVARLAGTDTAEIIVPVSLEEAGLLKIPRPGDGKDGSPVVVELTTGGTVHRWQGTIVRSLGEVDPRGRLTRLVAAVEDPFGLKGDTRRGPLALRIVTCSSIPGSPPMPEPVITPMRSRSFSFFISRPECSNAIFAAAIP